MAWWILYFLCICEFQLEFGTVAVLEVQDPPYSIIAVSVVSNHPSLLLAISFLIFHSVLHCCIYLYGVEYNYKYLVLGHSMLLVYTLCWWFIPISCFQRFVVPQYVERYLLRGVCSSNHKVTPYRGEVDFIVRVWHRHRTGEVVSLLPYGWSAVTVRACVLTLWTVFIQVALAVIVRVECSHRTGLCSHRIDCFRTSNTCSHCTDCFRMSNTIGVWRTGWESWGGFVRLRCR